MRKKTGIPLDVRVRQNSTGFMLETLHLAYRYLLGLTYAKGVWNSPRIPPHLQKELGRRLSAFYSYSVPTKFHHSNQLVWPKKKSTKRPAGKTSSKRAAKAATRTSASSSAS